MSMSTPWGEAQHQHKITDGVYEVDTAGHGGILVDLRVAQTLLSPEAIEKGWNWNGRQLAYEEDCDWALFVYEQPELYTEARNRRYVGSTYLQTPEQMKEIAYKFLLICHKNYLIAKGLVPLAPNGRPKVMVSFPGYIRPLEYATNKEYCTRQILLSMNSAAWAEGEINAFLQEADQGNMEHLREMFAAYCLEL